MRVQVGSTLAIILSVDREYTSSVSLSWKMWTSGWWSVIAMLLNVSGGAHHFKWAKHGHAKHNIHGDDMSIMVSPNISNKKETQKKDD